MARSQNGWPASSNPSAIGVVSFSVAGVKFPNGVVEGDVHTIFSYLALQYHLTVEPLMDPGCWGFNYREIEGSNDLSNHASGTAIDINAPKHPLGVRGTFTAAKKAAVRVILDFLEGVVRWGEDYTGRVDGMHFEIIGTPVQVSRVAQKVRTSGGGGIQGMLCRKGDRNDSVEWLQEMMKHAGYAITVDGDYGPATSAVLLKLRKDMGSSATSGDVCDGTAAMQVMMAFVKKQAPAGPRGLQGIQGPRGDAAVLAPGTRLVIETPAS